MSTDFPLRIGSVAGDSYPGAIPVHMADKTVLAMKVASETGEVRVMHAVPHTLVALGKYNRMDNAVLHTQRFMERANNVDLANAEKFNGLDMLVGLDSRQEIKIVVHNQVYRNFVF